MKWKNLPTYKIKTLFSQKRLCLLSGPVGTGKTTLQAYLVDYLLTNEPECHVYWLMLKSIVERFKSKLPKEFLERFHTTSNPNDDLIWYDSKGKTKLEFEKWLKAPKILVGDEVARFMDRFSNISEPTRVFGHLLGSIRQKSMTGILADQGNDFPVAGKEKGTYWLFTGATDFVAKKLQDSSTFRLQRWLNFNAPNLINLGEFNHYKLNQEGWGIAILTNGSRTWKFFFERPKWYTRDLSTILRYLRPSDILSIDSMEESKQVNINSNLFKCLMFAWHFMKDKKVNPTPEKLNNIFTMASPIFYDESRKDLPGKGRGYVQRAMVFCGTKDCPYCADPELYTQKLRILKDSRAFDKPKVTNEMQTEIIKLVEEILPF